MSPTLDFARFNSCSRAKLKQCAFKWIGVVHTESSKRVVAVISKTQQVLKDDVVLIVRKSLVLIEALRTELLSQ